jgi:hypothetical protein
MRPTKPDIGHLVRNRYVAGDIDPSGVVIGKRGIEVLVLLACPRSTGHGNGNALPLDMWWIRRDELEVIQ